MSQLISEEDAAFFVDNFDSLTPEQQVQARDVARRYDEQQRYDLGQPLFPSMLKKQADQENAFNSMFESPSNVDVQAPHIATIVPHLDDPDTARKQWAIKSYLGKAYNVAPEDLGPGRYEHLRDYHAKELGSEPGDNAVYAKLGELIKSKKEGREAAYNATLDGVRAGVASIPLDQALTDFDSSNPEAGSDSRNAFINSYNDVPEALKAGGGAFLDAVERSMHSTFGSIYDSSSVTGAQNADMTQAKEGPRQGDDATIAAMRDMLPDIPAQYRRALLAVMTERGKEAEKGFLHVAGEAGYRTLEAMFTGNVNAQAAEFIDTVGSDATHAYYTTLPSITNAKEAQQFLREQVSNLDLQRSSNGYPVELKGVQRTLSEGELKLVNEAKRRELRTLQVGREIRQLGQAADPLKTAYGTWADYAASGIGSSAAIIAPIATMGWASLPMMTMAYKGQIQDDLRLDHPEISDAQASTIGAIAAPVMAALDHAEFSFIKGVPAIKQFLQMERKQLTRDVLMRAALKTGVAIAGENTVEAVQDISPQVTQGVISALSDDMPSVDWNSELQKWGSERFGTFIGMLPLLALGSGDVALSDVRNAREIMDSADNLRAAGYADSTIEEVHAKIEAGDVEGAHAALIQGWNERDTQRAQLWQEKLGRADGAKQRISQATTDEANARGIALVREDGKWSVKRQDGRSVPVEDGQRGEILTRHLLQASNETEANAFNAILDAFSGLDKITVRGDVQFTQGERVFSSSPFHGVTEITDAKTLESVRAQRAGLGMEEDTLINGTNHEYADSIGGTIKRAIEIGLSPSQRGIVTALHEGLESNLNRSLSNGTFTTEQLTDAIREIAPAIQARGGNTELAGRVAKIVAGDANDVVLRETMTELATAETMRRDYNGEKLPWKAGTISAIIEEQAAKTSDPAKVTALGKLKSWLRAARNYIAGLFGVARGLDKFKAENKTESFDSLVDKMLGLEETSFARSVANEAGRIASGSHSFAGINSKMSDEMARSLAAAQAMAAGGKSAEEIRALTGWFPGKYDGKMRYEVPDQEAKLNLPERKGRLAVATDWLKSQGFSGDVGSQKIPEQKRIEALAFADRNIASFKLGDILSHDALFNAYPDSANITVQFVQSQDLYGSFNEKTNTITISEGKINEDSNRKLSTLLHEVQHWIQRKEGFATGSSPNKMAFGKDADNAMAAIEPRLTAISSRLNKIKIRNRELSELRKEMGDAWFSSQEVKESMALSDEVSSLLREQGDLQHKLRNKVAFALYRNTAGEIESRDVQARQSFTDEQRKAIAPYSSENIAPEDAIVMFGNNQSFSLSPISKTDHVQTHLDRILADHPEAKLIAKQRAKRAVARLADRYTGLVARESPAKLDQGQKDQYEQERERLANAAGYEFRSTESLKNERDFRQADLSKTMDAKAAKAEAQKWMDDYKARGVAIDNEAKQKALQWRIEREGERAKLGHSRNDLVRDLATLQAATMFFPPEVRAKIGGVTKLASLATDEARQKEIERRLDKAGKLMESHLQKEFRAAVDKLIEKSKTGEAGKKSKGKIGPDGHELFKLAEAAMAMTPEQAEKEIAGLEAQINSDPTNENADLWARQLDVIDRLSDWKNATSSRMESALELLQDIYKGGLADWRIIQTQKREEARSRQDAWKRKAGVEGDAPERDQAKRDAVTLSGWLKGNAANLSSFPELVTAVIGNNAESKFWIDSERRSANAYEDAMQGHANDVDDFWTREANGNFLDGQKLLYDLRHDEMTVEGRKLSQIEAITVLLTWRQEDGKRHMEGPLDESGKPTEWHYGQSFVDAVAANLKPEAKRFMDWLTAQYGAEHAYINPKHKEVNGINLPQNDFYAPLTLTPQTTKTSDIVDPLSGHVQQGASLLPQSFRARSRIAIAEPRFDDALAVYMAHKKQIEHWMAYVDFVEAFRAIAGDRASSNVTLASAGPEVANMLKMFYQTLIQQGIKDSASQLEMHRSASKAMGRLSRAMLIGKLSVLGVQATQLGAASAHMPTTDYLMRLGKLFITPSMWAAARNSEFIQRRIATMTPQVRMAMNDIFNASRPNLLSEGVRRLGNLINGADGLFTAGTYAIIYDYKLSQAKDMGVTGADAEAWAKNEAERLTEEVAQPTRMAQRSMVEITTTNPLAKVGWTFASDARQKLSFTAWAARSKNPKRIARAMLMSLFFNGFVSQVIRNAWREAKGDDDKRKWKPHILALQSVDSLLGGLPYYGPLRGAAGLMDIHGVVGVIEALATDKKDWDELTQRDVSNILAAASLISEPAADLASVWSMMSDFYKLVMPDKDQKK